MNSHRTPPGAGFPERQNGFTIIEVMVALGILAFGILAIASMQTASLSGTSLAGSTTDATTTGMNQLEQLIARPYSHSDLTNGSHPAVVQGRYTISWTVNDGQPFTNTKTIQVTVQWPEKGVSKTSALTYIKMDVV